MTTGFVGRERELALLNRRLVRAAATGDGTALVIRGRRQVGKSRLAQEFCNTADVPYLFYTATKGASPVEAITAFFAELAESSLPRDRAPDPDRSGEQLARRLSRARLRASRVAGRYRPR